MSSPLPWGMRDAYAVFGASMCPWDMRRGGLEPIGVLPSSLQWLPSGYNALRRGVKRARTPVAIFGSLGVCIYVPASRHGLMSYSPIHLT